VTDPLLLTALSPSVEWEKDVQWWVVGAEEAPPGSWNVPHRWQRALSTPGSIAQRITALWSGLELLLPRTMMAYASRARCLALLYTRECGLSLVYVFNNAGELTAQRGFRPVQALPAIASQFPVDLAPFYQLHDGLVNVWSGDGGLLPIAQWQTLVDPESGQQSLVKMANNGPDAFGFDVSATPVQAYSVWPDEDEVRLEQDTWGFLDNLLASWVEDL
jgi:hypothetical protein